MSTREHTHGNKICPSSPPQDRPDVRKVPASSVPYGECVCRHGQHVYAAYEPGTGRLVCIGSTALEARRKYREARLKERMSGGGGGSNL